MRMGIAEPHWPGSRTDGQQFALPVNDADAFLERIDGEYANFFFPNSSTDLTAPATESPTEPIGR
jgi:hypothetical protein